MCERERKMKQGKKRKRLSNTLCDDDSHPKKNELLSVKIIEKNQKTETQTTQHNFLPNMTTTERTKRREIGGKKANFLLNVKI